MRYSKLHRTQLEGGEGWEGGKYVLQIESAVPRSAVPCASVFALTWATGWMIGVLGFDSRRGLGIFLITIASRTALRPTQPPIQWVPGALSLGVKAAGA
jgi:hypothetical protein